MIPAPEPRPLQRPSPTELLSFIVAYLKLLRGRWEAVDHHLDPSAVPIAVLHFQENGVRAQILLWMMFHGHVEHFQRTSGGAEAGTLVQPALTLVISETSAFALTAKGEAFADAFLAEIL